MLQPKTLLREARLKLKVYVHIHIIRRHRLSDYHASGGFLSHHLARISVAAVYWDAQHIDEGIRLLKQRAQPLAPA